jgi:hypothetical protein
VLDAVPDRLDGVFHAAGVAGGGPVHLLDLAEWNRVIGINLTGTFLVAKAALARMIEQERVDGERGSLVTVASIEGLEGTAGGSSYNADKGGVVLLTKNSRAMHAMIQTWTNSKNSQNSQGCCGGPKTTLRISQTMSEDGCCARYCGHQGTRRCWQSTSVT